MNQEQYLTSAYGVRIPRIIYGTAWKKERTAGLTMLAIRLGFRGIDTACQPKHYHEAGVGEAVAASVDGGLSRSEFYLQSKFTPLNGQDPLQIPYDAKASLSEQVFQSCRSSLFNLQTSYLDCLVLHSPLPDPKQFLEVWRAMEQLFHKGDVKQLGISNCYDIQQLAFLHKSAEVKPAILQNRFYADSGYDREIREFCRQQQIIYQSFWTLSANPVILSHVAIQNPANRYQRSAAQIFFRYLSQIGIIPLTGTSSENHMRDDLAIFDFKLNADECAAIKTLI